MVVKKIAPKSPRKLGRPKGVSPAQRNLRTLKIQEIINLSETHLIRVLKGETNLSLKDVTTVALELYKKRIPAKVETDNTGNKLTIIKIVKNHIPEKQLDTIDIDSTNLEQAASDAISRLGVAEGDYD